MCLTWHPQGLLACRTVKRCSEHFDLTAVMSVGIIHGMSNLLFLQVELRPESLCLRQVQERQELQMDRKKWLHLEEV